MTIRLHLCQKREDVFRLGHEHGLVSVRRHRLVLPPVHEWRDEVFVGDDAHDAVDVLVVHGKARIAGAAHSLDSLAHRLDVLDEDHVHTRLHDLVNRHVAEVDDVVDHALLVVKQLVVVGDHELDLFFGHVLTLVGVFDAQHARKAVRRNRGERHQRRGDLLEHHERTGHRFAHALGVGQRDALRHELSHDDAQIRHHERDEHGSQPRRDDCKPLHAQTRQPGGERIGEVRGGGGRGEEPDERDGHLDGGQKLAGVGGQRQRAAGALVPFLGLVLQQHLLRVDQRHLRHGEVPVNQDEHERYDDAYPYVHE